MNVGNEDGWLTLSGEPFDEMVGPFHYRKDGAGGVVCRFRPESKNLNGLGLVHGGSLLTFADYCLFVSAMNATDGLDTITVSLSSDFIGASRENDVIEGRTQIIRDGKSLLFIRGMLEVEGNPVLSFSGVLKKLKSKKAL